MIQNDHQQMYRYDEIVFTRICDVPANSIHRRSMPRPQPAVGGKAYSKAAK